MKRLPAIFLICCIAVSAVANPLVPFYPAYISSEYLEVTLGDTAAKFSGSFRFSSSGPISEAERGSDVYLNIPIWIPANAAEGDQTMKNFYATFTPERTKLDSATRPIFDHVFEFEIRIGGRVHPINGFALADVSDRKHRRFAESAWLQSGFSHVVVFVTFRPETLKGDPEFRITYRQPLRLRRGKSEMFYVPDFDHLPVGQSTNDLNLYALVLKNPGYPAVSALKYNIPARSSMTLPISHHVPILVRCDQ